MSGKMILTFFLIILGSSAWAADYFMVMRSGQIHHCSQKYTVTTDRMISFQLTSGPILEFQSRDIDWQETSRQNGGDPPPDWVEIIDDEPEDADKTPRGGLFDNLAQNQDPRVGEFLEYLGELIPLDENGELPPDAGPMVFVGLGLMGLGSFISFLGWIWMVVVGFRENLVWGILMLCCNFILIQIIFLVQLWEEAKWPFLVYISGIAIVYLGIYLAGT